MTRIASLALVFTLALGLGGLGGCSLMRRDIFRGSPVITEYDCPSRVWPIADVVGVAPFAYLTAEAVIHRNDADSAANLFIFPMGAVAALYAASAIYGFVAHARCERRFAPN